ncbi:hypothetical protein GCM10008957_53570 [Deinococcus ruber]|uniref:Translation elongation factor EFTu/EF1A C-terminal domain-containing protein n=1 Tax=Deinococcus ruber TaxID=1848197 RepID=A0A918KWT0_9DEIO|nr:hypothetical protein GCM10008957_53570 [Deinococcus ruber]
MSSKRPTQLDAYDVEAFAWYLPTEKGGRKAYIQSGYWGQFFYENDDWEVGHYFDDPPILVPGEERTVRLRFMSPEKHVGRLVVGSISLFREGQRVIGYGRVTWIGRRPACCVRASCGRNRAG